MIDFYTTLEFIPAQLNSRSEYFCSCNTRILAEGLHIQIMFYAEQPLQLQL